MPIRILLVLPLFALAACAHHEEQGPAYDTYSQAEPLPEEKITRFADENRDGEVTRKEAEADPALAAAFDRFDLDKNEKLDRGEFARLEAERKQRVASVPVRVESEPLPADRSRSRRGGHSLNRTGIDEIRPEEQTERTEERP